MEEDAHSTSHVLLSRLEDFFQVFHIA